LCNPIGESIEMVSRGKKFQGDCKEQKRSTKKETTQGLNANNII
jgi:hypothetical protein